MNVFQLRENVIHDYAEYVRSFVQIREGRLREFVNRTLTDQALWPQPLIQMNPSFEPGGWIDDLVSQGVLHEGCRPIFRIKSETDASGAPMRLHKHQVDAIGKAQSRENCVLTTGTGSGKSLAYMIPIVDHVLRNGRGLGIQAIVVYPMNALCNSQSGELEKFLRIGFGRGEMFPTPRDAVDYIMNTFPIVRRKDEQAHGEYRTKRVILEIYDEMAEAIRTGCPYQTRLTPPPRPPHRRRRQLHPRGPMGRRQLARAHSPAEGRRQ